MRKLRDTWQELRELGPRRVAFRVGWELRARTELGEWLERRSSCATVDLGARADAWLARLPYADAESVRARITPRLTPRKIAELGVTAQDAARGELTPFFDRAFSYGDPIDWQLNPQSRERWDARVHWSRALRDEPRVGDIKLTWEPARFGHAYAMARAATFGAQDADGLARSLLAQMSAFARDNPWPSGVHWASSQELVFRLFAWLFATRVLLDRPGTQPAASELVREQALLYARHIRAHLDYARLAVYNNHLLSEACGLYVVGLLFAREGGTLARWRDEGHALLVAEAERQFYADGAYIQQSHNYHRVALHVLLVACVFARASGGAPHGAWLAALSRSLDFLLAHQNPDDGRLSNYGANDGALPLVLDTCAYSDFRPVLQTVSLLTRGERLYEPGPWDEAAAWLLGPACLDAPSRSPARKSVAFRPTGYFVLRGEREDTFTTFRCGTLRDRFAQIDMLHVDAWWRGENVLVDGGSYLYNGPPAWHAHFMGTASHNTVQIDGADQMLHKRRFKVVHWTRARDLAFADAPGFALVAGEHYGYGRLAGGLVHRRCVLVVKDGAWIVIDRVVGEGEHAVRLHWLLGTARYEVEGAGVRARFGAGDLHLGVYTRDGAALPLDLACGVEDPPRGWLSRHYASKTPALSVVHEQRGALPLEVISIISEAPARVTRVGTSYTAELASRRVCFDLDDGIATRVVVS